ncbi:hypothetical protein BDF19DRAFT_412925 [Syncephalis fuscata]|nr:hypothetical protein BDF19DRAFT_412925 [Syncephalis fuscata]
MNKYIHATLLLLAVANAASFVAAERFNAQLIQPGPTPKYEIALLSPMLKRQPSHFGPVGNPVDVAKAFVRQNIKIKDSDYVIKDSYVTKSTGVTHVYFKQLFQGVEVTNGDISVNVDAGGKVITYGDSFYHSSDASKRNLWAGQSSQRFVEPSKAPSKITIIPYINPNDKKKQYILQNIPYVLKDVITQQSYIHTADGSLKAAWEFFVDLGDNYFNAHVSADGKEVVSLFDWISDATYNVVKVGDAGPNTSSAYY